jgi:hypothetical protein
VELFLSSEKLTFKNQKDNLNEHYPKNIKVEVLGEELRIRGFKIEKE